jgi:hypothetical protein
VEDWILWFPLDDLDRRIQYRGYLARLRAHPQVESVQAELESNATALESSPVRISFKEGFNPLQDPLFIELQAFSNQSGDTVPPSRPILGLDSISEAVLQDPGQLVSGRVYLTSRRTGMSYMAALAAVSPTINASAVDIPEEVEAAIRRGSRVGVSMGCRVAPELSDEPLLQRSVVGFTPIPAEPAVPGLSVALPEPCELPDWVVPGAWVEDEQGVPHEVYRITEDYVFLHQTGEHQARGWSRRQGHPFTLSFKRLPPPSSWWSRLVQDDQPELFG